jgi:predicted DNA-binding transcriptional regulator YafY
MSEPEIQPKEINNTENRQLTLLMTLFKSRIGMNFKQIKSQMTQFYDNEKIESDQKKLYRDILDLRENGFPVHFYKTTSNLESNIYRFDRNKFKTNISLTDIELRKLSTLIMRKYSEFQSPILFSSMQKIFSKNLEYFPENLIKPITVKVEKNKNEELLYSIMNAIKNKTPLKIEYKKNSSDTSIKEIDPLLLIKRESLDTYLIAYDRKKKLKKRYIIQKISNISELNEEFIFLGKIVEEDKNYHSLNFPVHDSILIELEIEPDFFWKLERFLYPHPYTKNGNKYSFYCTNKSALFPFLLKCIDINLNLEPNYLKEEFKNYIQEIIDIYTKEDK